jgi:hypothetical protein
LPFVSLLPVLEYAAGEGSQVSFCSSLHLWNGKRRYNSVFLLFLFSYPAFHLLIANGAWGKQIGGRIKRLGYLFAILALGYNYKATTKM